MCFRGQTVLRLQTLWCPHRPRGAGFHGLRPVHVQKTHHPDPPAGDGAVRRPTGTCRAGSHIAGGDGHIVCPSTHLRFLAMCGRV